MSGGRCRKIVADEISDAYLFFLLLPEREKGEGRVITGWDGCFLVF